jgi:simple sugar transport system permease protein
MLMGAVVGFWAVQRIHADAPIALTLAVLAAALAGALTALVHAVLVIGLRANQIVSGLALTIFAGATGFSSYLGNVLGLGDAPARHSFGSIDVFGLASAPIVGPILFHQYALVYVSWAMVALVALYLARTRPGLNVRAVGHAPASADAMGISVARYRYAHTLAGGAFAGVGGACFSLAITPQWVDGLTQGAGWIAIALVIFAFWRAELCLVGAYLFGAFSSLGFTLQARGVTIAPEFLNALPYVMTIAVLVAVSSGGARRRLGAPGALGRPYAREER